jgi:hypothetical protein
MDNMVKGYRGLGREFLFRNLNPGILEPFNEGGEKNESKK